MKIGLCGLLPTEFKHKGGGAENLVKLAIYLSKKGNEVTVFTRDTPSPISLSFLLDHEVDVRFIREVPLQCLYFATMPFRVIKLLYPDIDNIDVIHSFIGSFAFGAGLLKMLGVFDGGIITDIRDIHIHNYESDTKKKLHNKCENALMKLSCFWSDKVIVHSQFMKELACKLWNLDKNSVEIIPNGIDINRFRIFEKYDDKYDLIWENADCRLLYVGRISYRKGIIHLIKAMRDIIKIDRRKVLLLIVGDGELLGRCKGLVTKYGLGDNIRFYGQASQDELPLYYNSADYCIVPSLYEPFGMVPLESLACGTPVIVARNTGLKEIISEDVGIFFEKVNSYEISRTLLSVLDNQIALKKEDFRKYVIKNYNWNNIAPIYEDIYANFKSLEKARSKISRGVK